MADNNDDQEAEEIRYGFADVDRDSTKPLRQAVIATANGWDIPQDVLAALIEIEERAIALRSRSAVLLGEQAPSRPEWLVPKP